MKVKGVKILAVGYDVDGTLVDSEPLHNSAWYDTLRKYNREFTDLPVEFQRTMAGRKPIEIAKFMVGSLNLRSSPEKFLAQKNALFMAKVRDELRPMPGAVESVIQLSKEFKLGIGAALNREYVDLALEVLGLTGKFSAIVTGDRVNLGKPDPETYNTMAFELGVDPRSAVILEDATSGIASAKSAGCWCVAVKSSDGITQDLSLADAIVNDLNEVTVELISNSEPKLN